MGHLVDLELRRPEPGPRGGRPFERRAVRDRAGLGVLGRDHPHRPRRPRDQLVQLPVRRRARRAISLGSTPPGSSRWPTSALGLQSDPLDASAEDLQTAKEYCIEKTKNSQSIWVDFTQLWDDVRQGNIWAAYPGPTPTSCSRRRCPSQYIRPKEAALAGARGSSFAPTPRITTTRTSSPTPGRRRGGPEAHQLVGLRPLEPEGGPVEMTPDVVKVFGLDDPETNLSAPLSIMDQYQPQRATRTTGPGTRSRRRRAKASAPSDGDRGGSAGRPARARDVPTRPAVGGGRRPAALLATPMVWMLVFFVAPVVLVGLYSVGAITLLRTTSTCPSTVAVLHLRATPT